MGGRGGWEGRIKGGRKKRDGEAARGGVPTDNNFKATCKVQMMIVIVPGGIKCCFSESWSDCMLYTLRRTPMSA